jgi:hypothetical protein
MKHVAQIIQTIQDLDDFLQEHSAQAAAAQSILAQVFVSSHDHDWISKLCAIIRARIDRVVIAGTTTAGEICAGRSVKSISVVSLSFFESTRLVPVVFPVHRGSETAAGEKLCEALKAIDGSIQGVLLFATPFTIDCNRLLKTIHDHLPELPLFGAGAADYGSPGRSTAFSHEDILDTGLVAIAMVGEALRVSRHVFLGWRPIGKTMTITKVANQAVMEIDGQPAFEVYQRYLGIKAGKNFFFHSLEFPLLFKRGNHTIAATATNVNADGSVQFITDIKEGEAFQFGYGDIEMILNEIPRLQKEVSQFGPQGIFIYSCMTRRFLLQDEVDLEIYPFQQIAPTAGFFTGGEFCNLGDQSPYLNTTIVLVGLREGDAQPLQVSGGIFEESLQLRDPFLQRHTRIVSSLRYFLEATTRELSQANTELQKKLTEIKQLRGILPICASCKKIRDDKGYWKRLEIYIGEHSEAEFSHGICPSCAGKLYPELFSKKRES